MSALLALLAASAVTGLSPGAAVERGMKAGDAHPYEVELRAGEYFQAMVEQRGVDVRVSLIDPAGRTILEIDGPTADDGPEPVAFVAEADGVHRLVVHAGTVVQAPTRYELRVEAVRAPTAQDRLRVEAVRLTSEAMRPGGSTEERGKLAVAIGEKALAAWQAVGDVRMQAWSSSSLGYGNAAYLDRYAEAHEAFARALVLAREAGDTFAEAAALNNLGSSHRTLGRFEEARAALEQALALYRAAGYRVSEGRALNGLGYVLQAAGALQDALDRQHESLRLLDQPADAFHRAITQANLGGSYLRLGELELAIEQLQQALPAFTQPRRRARVVSQLGLAYFRLGDLARARAAYDEALGIVRKLGNRLLEAETLRRLAELRREEGDLDAALAAASAAVAATTAQEPLGEAASRCELGEVQRRRGDAPAARAEFERTVSLARGTLTAHLLCAEAGLAGLARDAGDLPAARAHAEAAVEVAESLRASMASPRWRAGALASRQSLYELLIDIRMRQHAAAPEAGHDRAALEVSERARARSLLDGLAEGRTDVREGADPALLAEERALRFRLNTLADRQEEAASRGSAQRAEAIGREIRALAGAIADLEARLRRASPRDAGLSDPRPLTLEQIQTDVLDGDTVLLEYALGEAQSYLWAVTRGGATSHRLAPRAEIERAAGRLHGLVAEAGRAGWEPAAEELSRLVLPAGLSRTLTRRVLVVAPGALQYVPFGLLSPGGAGSPLVTRVEVVSAPSASVVATLRSGVRARPRASGGVFVFADPVFEASDPRVAAAAHPPAAPEARTLRPAERGGPLSRLPFSRQEAHAIAAVAPRGSARLALGFDASRQAASGGVLANYRIVHFATHGVLNARQAELSGVVLSLVDRRGRPQDGFLRLHDIYNLRLGADLVVLSGCQTGLGRDMRGEGLVGLARGFMHAGAPGVLASLWRVDDEATAELMKRFYRGLFVGNLKPAAALRAAQQEMAASRRWRAPYYWAGFSLHGDWS